MAENRERCSPIGARCLIALAMEGFNSGAHNSANFISMGSLVTEREIIIKDNETSPQRQLIRQRYYEVPWGV